MKQAERQTAQKAARKTAWLKRTDLAYYDGIEPYADRTASAEVMVNRLFGSIVADRLASRKAVKQ